MALRKSLSWRIQKVYVEFGHVKPFLMMAYKRQARILIHYKKNLKNLELPSLSWSSLDCFRFSDSHISMTLA